MEQSPPDRDVEALRLVMSQAAEMGDFDTANEAAAQLWQAEQDSLPGLQER